VLTYLVETGALDAKERAHLRRLLDEPPSAAEDAKPQVATRFRQKKKHS
jgi:hypothetical protein